MILQKMKKKEPAVFRLDYPADDRKRFVPQYPLLQVMERVEVVLGVEVIDPAEVGACPNRTLTVFV